LLPYLLEHPPVHILIAAIVGFEPRTNRQGAPRHIGAAELAAAVGPGFGVGPDVHAGLPQVAIVDFNQLKKRSYGKG
jgi:hypothetical protein